MQSLVSPATIAPASGKRPESASRLYPARQVQQPTDFLADRDSPVHALAMKAVAAAHDRAGSALSIAPPPPAPTKLRAPQQTSLQTKFRPWRNLKAPTQFRPTRRPQVRRWPIADDAPTTLPASLENPRGPIPPACAAPVPASRRARPAAAVDRTAESSAGLFPAPQAPTARES